ncbi:MAG: thermonuclease family protein [Synergistaceae bacterium]|jgi:micrococcal nuclease|nr:thermonuclease family protein [Synergistaceae bacterium]
MKKKRKGQKLVPQLTVKKIISLAGTLLLGAFYLFFAPGGDVLSGTVTRVVDGDTIHVTVAGEDRTVRLIGVDTPETVHPRKPVEFYGKEASDFTKKNLTNKTVWLEYDVAPLDRYNRHLAYVWLTKPGTGETAIRKNMFNAQLVLQGYGKIMTIQPNSKYSQIFAKFQEEARNNKRGLWGK